MSEAEKIARALKGRKSGNGWVCNCPSLTHGSHDRNPSLSVTDGKDGKLLLRCHKGCEFADVMDALRSRGIVETPIARMNARAAGARPAPSSYSLEETFEMPKAHVEPLRRGRAWNPLEWDRSHMLTRMETGKFKVFDTLLDWFEEFRLFHRKDGKVVKEGDDLLSATRYGVMMLRFAEQIYRKNKPRRRQGFWYGTPGHAWMSG